MARKKMPEDRNYKGPLKQPEVRRMLKLHLGGNTFEEIAELTNRSRSSVQKVVEDNRELLELAGCPPNFAQMRSNLLNALQFKLIKSMLKDDRIDSATLRDLSSAFGITHKATRLEEDKSTSNTSTNTTFTKLDLTNERNDPQPVIDITNDTE